jgi:glycosyltransferase involved in cell wall biosynthesis
MELQPKISVLIPTYNYAHFLDETIQSVLNQSFRDFELIVVDNHSTDNTEEVVKKYLVDSRVSYYKNTHNLGLVGNWNKCLTYAKAEYIKFVCSDDKIHPQMFEKYYSVMEQYPTVSLITCYKQLFDGQPWLVELPLNHLQNGKDVIFHTMNSKSWIGEPTSVMFRKANLPLGDFRTDLILHVDWEMWNRHLTVGDCYIIPEALAYVRAHVRQHTNSVINLSCFEEYKMANLLYDYPALNNLADRKKIDKLVKQKASTCAKVAMYKELPKLINQKHRKVFIKALRITWKEKVFTNGFLLLWKGMRVKTMKKITKSNITAKLSSINK